MGNSFQPVFFVHIRHRTRRATRHRGVENYLNAVSTPRVCV
jgi:hypothetical protein